MTAVIGDYGCPAVNAVTARRFDEQAERLILDLEAATESAREAREVHAAGGPPPSLTQIGRDTQTEARAILDGLAKRWPSDELDAARRLLARSADAFDCAAMLGETR